MLPESKFLHQCLAQHCRRIKLISDIIHLGKLDGIGWLLDELMEEYTYPESLAPMPDRLLLSYNKPLLEKGASLEERAKVFEDNGNYEAAALIRELVRLGEEG